MKLKAKIHNPQDYTYYSDVAVKQICESAPNKPVLDEERINAIGYIEKAELINDEMEVTFELFDKFNKQIFKELGVSPEYLYNDKDFSLNAVSIKNKLKENIK